MTFRLSTTAILAAVSLGLPAWAEITVQDAYARSASPMAKTGAAFMTIDNSGDADDRLVAASSAAAARVELHTHVETDGMMNMVPIEGGIGLPAHGSHTLMRGGDHIMFMGLTASWKDGDLIPVTLTFEHADPVTIEIPVDLTRMPMSHGAQATQGN